SAPIFSGNQNLKAFETQLPRGREYPTIAAWGQIESALVADFGKMYDSIAQNNGPLTRSHVQQMMQQANQDVDAAIAQSKCTESERRRRRHAPQPLPRRQL